VVLQENNGAPGMGASDFEKVLFFNYIRSGHLSMYNKICSKTVQQQKKAKSFIFGFFSRQAIGYSPRKRYANCLPVRRGRLLGGGV